jgi:hypothetical protein
VYFSAAIFEEAISAPFMSRPVDPVRKQRLRDGRLTMEDSAFARSATHYILGNVPSAPSTWWRCHKHKQTRPVCAMRKLSDS